MGLREQEIPPLPEDTSHVRAFQALCEAESRRADHFRRSALVAQYEKAKAEYGAARALQQRREALSQLKQAEEVISSLKKQRGPRADIGDREVCREGPSPKKARRSRTAPEKSSRAEPPVEPPVEFQQTAPDGAKEPGAELEDSEESGYAELPFDDQ